MARRKEMLKALKDSIEHWYTNLMLAYAHELSKKDIQGISCPCCILSHMYIPTEDEGCPNCILVEDEHCSRQCDDSPWYSVSSKLPMHEDTERNWEAIIESVLSEIQFLEEAYLKSKG